MSLYDSLVEQIKGIDIEKIGNGIVDKVNIIDTHKSYIWIRVHLRSDFINSSKLGDDFKIIWDETGEELECKFITFGKKGRNSDWEDIINYEKEFDESIMILMVDEELIKSDNIPFIRSLFPNYKWYTESVFRTDSLKFYNKTSDLFLEYTFIQF